MSFGRQNSIANDPPMGMLSPIEENFAVRGADPHNCKNRFWAFCNYGYRANNPLLAKSSSVRLTAGARVPRIPTFQPFNLELAESPRFSGIRRVSARFRTATCNILRYHAVSADSLCDGWLPTGFSRQRMRFRRAIIRRFRECKRRFRRTGGEVLAEGPTHPPGGKRVFPLGGRVSPPWG